MPRLHGQYFTDIVPVLKVEVTRYVKTFEMGRGGGGEVTCYVLTLHHHSYYIISCGLLFFLLTVQSLFLHVDKLFVPRIHIMWNLNFNPSVIDGIVFLMSPSNLISRLQYLSMIGTIFSWGTSFFSISSSKMISLFRYLL